MRLTEKKKVAQPGALETIQVPGHEAQITMSLRLSKTSVRGQQAYRRMLKAVIETAEQQLGRYRRKRK